MLGRGVIVNSSFSIFREMKRRELEPDICSYEEKNENEKKKNTFSSYTLLNALETNVVRFYGHHILIWFWRRKYRP